MKRTKNRILSVFLSFCMIISCMAGINVTAGAETTNAPVSYLDETGAEKTCSDYIAVTGETEDLTDGNWYVVNNDVTLTGGLYVFGDANLILCDGATLTVNKGISCYNNGGFTIYAQSTGGNMGKLIATYGEDAYGIGIEASKNYIITINGGDIQATGQNFNSAIYSPVGIENYDNSVIINGGKVTASGYTDGIGAKNLTINGGEVVASGNKYGINGTNGITINGGEVIASSTKSSAIRGKLTVADGLTVFGDDSADPTTERTDYAETRWKYMTVKPEPVSYLDENGMEQTCSKYIAIKDAIGELTDGKWYVVNSDVPVTVNNVLYVDGNVNLILCDGAMLTVNGGITCSGDGGFTIYAQSTGESMGKLIATFSEDCAYGIGNNDNHCDRTITINGGDIQATGSPTDTYEPDTGIYNGDNPVIINGGKVTASGYDGGIEAESVTINGGEVTVSSNSYGINVTNGVTINGGEVIASSTEKMAIDGNLTVADGLTVFGGDSADPTTVRTNYATNRWNYMTVKAAVLYSVTLTGGANATPDPADGVSQTDVYGDMATVVYTANSGYYFEELADITVNGITATRIDAETVRVSGTPTGDVVFTVPDATATATFSSTVNVVWSETLVKPEKLTATLAGVDSYTLNAENSWSNTVTGLTQANNNWSIDCPVGYSFSSSTVDTVTTFTFTYIPMPSPESVTADSITLEEVTGYEYSKDNGETWQDSPTFTGLAPGTHYQFVQRPKGTAFKSRTNVFCIVAVYVKFNVVNGKWDDGTNAEKTVVLVRTTNEDLVLTLKSSDIPAVGSNPDNGYKAGSWDTVPTTEAEVSADKTFTYTYAEKTTPTITAVPTALAITYGQTLADSMLTGGSADVDGTFAWTTNTIAPAVADSNTTEYDVTFKPNDTDNYTTAACKVKLTVGKAKPTITTAPTASPIKYGQTLADSMLTGGSADVDGTFAWTTKTTAPAVADSNTTEYDVTFKPNDTDNYTTAACKVKLTVGKAKPTITTAPTASPIKYGQTLADSMLTGGSADVDGTFAWTTKTTAPAVADSDTTEYDVTFTPTDKDNYTTAACKVKLTVGKAKPTITTAPTASPIKYGQTLADSMLTGGSADVDGTFAWTTKTTAPAVADSDTTEYDVTFTPTDKDNYTTAACKVKLTVGKAEPTITTAPTALAITYGKTLADSKLSGGSADVDGTFAWTTNTIAPAVADSNTTEYDVTFKPNDTDNYTTAACKVKLTVGKAKPTITTAPTASPIKYGQTLADSMLTGGSADVDGTFAWTTKTTAPAVADSDTTEYDVTFTPTDKDNYTTAACKVKLTVGKADQEVPAVTAFAETIKGKADGKITGVNATMEYRADGENDYKPVTGIVITDLESGIYHVRVKGDDNHFASPDTTVTVEAGSMLTVTFMIDSTTVYSTAECEYKGTVSAPAADPEMGGKKFKYWHLGGERFDFSTEITEDIELIARWGDSYSIKVIQGKADKTSAEAGETVRITADDWGGMYFCYWNSDVVVEFKNKGVRTTTFTMPASDVEITAIFTSITPVIPEPSGGSSTSITPSPTWTEPSKDTEADIPVLSITGVQDARNQSALSWNNVPGATNYSLYVKVGGKYAFVQDLGTSTAVDVVRSTSGKYYVSTGGNYNIYEYNEKTGKFGKTGTLEASKIDDVVKANNVTNDFMIKYKVNGKESAEKDSYKVSVKIYYKPAPKATFKDGKVTIKWAKVEGATMYRVMKKTSSGYKLVTETEKNSVRISKVKSGKYTYAVQALVDGEWTKVYKSDLASVTVK